MHPVEKLSKIFLENFPSNYFQIQAGSHQKPILTPIPRLPPHFLIRRREQAIHAETTNELVTEIKKNYKKSQKVYGLEIKRENLKLARDLEKAKQEKILHRDKFAYLSKQ